MKEINKKNFFLSITSKNIRFDAININENIYFLEKKKINSLVELQKLDELDKFLNENIFKIEKELNSYVKDINLIIDHSEFKFIDLSMKYNSYDIKFNSERLNNLLIELKNQFKNNIGDYDIIHMFINKFIVDGTIYYDSSQLDNNDKVCLEIRFICFAKEYINNLKDVLSKYQITLNNILCFEYLRNFKDFSEGDSSIIASKALNGLNENEIFFRKKINKKYSFFERFFNFFN